MSNDQQHDAREQARRRPADELGRAGQAAASKAREAAYAASQLLDDVQHREERS